DAPLQIHAEDDVFTGVLDYQPDPLIRLSKRLALLVEMDELLLDLANPLVKLKEFLPLLLACLPGNVISHIEMARAALASRPGDSAGEADGGPAAPPGLPSGQWALAYRNGPRRLGRMCLRRPAASQGVRRAVRYWPLEPPGSSGNLLSLRPGPAITQERLAC